MTIEGLPSGLSRFGTPATPVEKTAGWLRAKASGSGMELHAASQVDLTAACLGADSWLLVYRASRPEVGLDTPRRAGKHAVAAAAAIFARACGLGGTSTVDPSLEDLDQITIDKWLPTAEGLTEWARAQIGDTAAATALRYAASDLCAAGESSPAAGFASLLVACADTLVRGEHG